MYSTIITPPKKKHLFTMTAFLIIATVFVGACIAGDLRSLTARRDGELAD